MGRQVKVQLYNNTRTKEEILKKHGDFILDGICVSCKTEENLETSEFFLEAEFLIDDEGLYKCFHEDAVLKVLMDYGDEIFSIVNIRKTLSRIIVFARQITITETICTWFDDVRPDVKNGQGALEHMGEHGIGGHNLEFSSDIEVINTAYYMNKTMYDAIHIEDNCFLSRWGGEVKRRGYLLTIDEKIGEDRGFQVRRNKNLTGIEAVTNIDNIVTRIKPIGFNGITTEGYVDSPLIDNYKYVRTQTMKYDHVKLRADVENEEDEADDVLIYETLEEAQEKLTELALLEFVQMVDILHATYTINFVDLSKTEQYKEYIKIESVQLGDTISVIEEKHNININVRAMKKTYDVLSQKTIEIKVSNEAKIAESPKIEEIKTQIGNVAEEMNYITFTYAKIADLQKTNERVGDLEEAQIRTDDLLDGKLTEENVGLMNIKNGKFTIENGFIRNEMIADTGSITGSKLNINSVINSINDNGSRNINSSKVYMEDYNKTLRNAFDELQTQVDNLTEITMDGDLTSVITQVGTNTSNINTIQGDINRLNGQVTIEKEHGSFNLKDEYLSTVEVVNGHGNELSNIHDNISTISNRLDLTDEAVGQNTSSINDIKDNYYDKEQVGTIIDETEEKLGGLINSNANNITTINNTLSSNYDLIMGNTNRISASELNIESLHERTTELENVTNISNEGILGLDGRITSLEESVKNINDKISSLEEGVTNINDKISSLENDINDKISSIENDISDINTKMSEFKTAYDENINVNNLIISGLIKRIEDLEKKLR